MDQLQEGTSKVDFFSPPRVKDNLKSNVSNRGSSTFCGLKADQMAIEIMPVIHSPKPSSENNHVVDSSHFNFSKVENTSDIKKGNVGQIKDAIKSNDIVALVDLLKACDFDVQTRFENGTLLHVASEKGWLEVVQLISKKSNFDVNILNDSGWTALMQACLVGHSNVVEYLLSLPTIDIDHRAADRSALTLACWRRKKKNYLCPNHVREAYEKSYDDIIKMLFRKAENIDGIVIYSFIPLPAEVARYPIPYSDQCQRNCCGLSALAMVTGYWQSMENDSSVCHDEPDLIADCNLVALIDRVKKEGYTTEGEMFIAGNMLIVANMLGYEARLHEPESIDHIFELLEKGHPLILPYDISDSSSVGESNGQYAHYCVIKGHFSHNGKRHLIIKHSKSFNHDIILSAETFERSWRQLNHSHFYRSRAMPSQVLRHLKVGPDFQLDLAQEPVRDESKIEEDLKCAVEAGKIVIENGDYYLAAGEELGIKNTLAGCIIEVLPKTNG